MSPHHDWSTSTAALHSSNFLGSTRTASHTVHLNRRFMARQLGFQTFMFLAQILNSCQVTAIVIRAYKQLLFPAYAHIKFIQFHSQQCMSNMSFKNTYLHAVQYSAQKLAQLYNACLAVDQSINRLCWTIHNMTYLIQASSSSISRKNWWSVWASFSRARLWAANVFTLLVKDTQIQIHYNI